MHRIVDKPVIGQSGRPVAIRRFDPESRARSQIVIHGATAVPQGFYAAWATHLAGHGHRVFTYDYRGIGTSRRPGSLANDPVTMTDWMDDAALVQRRVADLDSNVPLVAVGHSFGGQIAAALRPQADAIVLIGAQSGYVGRFEFPRRVRMRLIMSYVMPALVAAFGYVPGWSGIGEDLPAGVARQWSRWCLSPSYFLTELPQLADAMARWSGSMLALSFTDDEYASYANVRWLLDRFAGADIDHRHLDVRMLAEREVGHFGFFRRASAASLWPMVDSFLEGVTGESSRARDEREILIDLQWGRA